MSSDLDHSIKARPRASLIEHLIEYFDRQVEMLLREGVPSDRIAEALRLTTVRVEILHGGGSDGDRQTSRSHPLRRFAVLAARSDQAATAFPAPETWLGVVSGSLSWPPPAGAQESLNAIGALRRRGKAVASSFMVQIASDLVSATESARTSTRRPLTVLVVEDDPALLSLAAYVFGKEGHRVLTNVDAFGALALLLSHSVDLLFTDIDLAQGTSGVTLARDARALRSDLPVAYTSGRVDLSPDQMVPGSVFLPKPYRLQEVIGLPERLAKF